MKAVRDAQPFSESKPLGLHERSTTQMYCRAAGFRETRPNPCSPGSYFKEVGSDPKAKVVRIAVSRSAWETTSALLRCVSFRRNPVNRRTTPYLKEADDRQLLSLPLGILHSAGIRAVTATDGSARSSRARLQTGSAPPKCSKILLAEVIVLHRTIREKPIVRGRSAPRAQHLVTAQRRAF